MKVEEPPTFRANLIQNLNKILKNEKLAKNVEKGIYYKSKINGWI